MLNEKPDVRIRFLPENQITPLREFLERMFRQRLTDAELLWRFEQGRSSGEYRYNVVAEGPEGEILGHTAYLPAEFIGPDRTYRAALSVCSAVSPDRAGLFPGLHEALVGRLRDDGFDFLYAFPNQHSFPFFSRYFGFWEHPFSLMQLRSPVSNSSGAVLLAKELGDPVRNSLSSSYRQWRIHSSPIRKYEVYRDDEVEIIYKRYGVDEVDAVHIRLLGDALSQHSIARFVSACGGPSCLHLYATNTAFISFLSETGFVAAPSRNHLVVKSLSGDLPPGGLFLQMMDSDVF